MTEIEKALIYYDGNGDMPYCDLVYEALKKQMPRKPIIIVDDIDDYIKAGRTIFGKGVKACICPSCAMLIAWSSNFCFLCGQALDWSEEANGINK